MTLGVFGRRVVLDIHDRQFFRLSTRAFAGLLCDPGPGDLSYVIRPGSSDDAGVVIERAGSVSLSFDDPGQALNALDDDLVIEVQKLRPDLLFLHAGAVSRDGRVTVLAGGRGAGKSTTVWALLHHGFTYLSDELAAVDPASQRVFPFARAVSLKRVSPAPYTTGLPPVDPGGAIRIPPSELPGPTASEPLPLGTIVFLDGAPGTARPALSRVPGSLASARLYAAALNPLAHAGDGLDVALRLVKGTPSFELTAGNLEETARLLASPLRA